MSKIIIQTDADFTPPGKRSSRVVVCSNKQIQLRWYVSGRLYNRMTPNRATLALTEAWVAAGH